MFNNFLFVQKIASFMTEYRKIWYSQCRRETGEAGKH